MADTTNLGSDKGNIAEFFLDGRLGTSPHTGSFDIDPYKIHFGIPACKANGIFALSAAKLQNNGVVIVEIVASPLVFQFKSFAAFDEAGLKKIREGVGFCEMLKFILAHGCC